MCYRPLCRLCLKTSLFHSCHFSNPVPVCLLCQLTVRQHGSRLVRQRGWQSEQEEEKTASPFVLLFIFIVLIVGEQGGQQPEQEVQSPKSFSLQRQRQEVRSHTRHCTLQPSWVEKFVYHRCFQIYRSRFCPVTPTCLWTESRKWLLRSFVYEWWLGLCLQLPSAKWSHKNIVPPSIGPPLQDCNIPFRYCSCELVYCTYASLLVCVVRLEINVLRLFVP